MLTPEAAAALARPGLGAAALLFRRRAPELLLVAYGLSELGHPRARRRLSNRVHRAGAEGVGRLRLSAA
jgi:hypothetical protein